MCRAEAVSVNWYAVVSYSTVRNRGVVSSVYGRPADYLDGVARDLSSVPSGPSDSVTLVIGPHPWLACVETEGSCP